MTYRLLADNVVQHIGDGAFIPDDPDNRDYRDYLDWLAEGNTPEPADPLPPPAPDWAGFIDYLRLTPLPGIIRANDRGLLAELRVGLLEARADIAYLVGLQTLFNEVALLLTAGQKTGLNDAFTQFNIPLSVT